MLFNTTTFTIFFGIVLILYWILRGYNLKIEKRVRYLNAEPSAFDIVFFLHIFDTLKVSDM